MTDHELVGLPALKLAELVRTRAVSPVEIVQAFLTRIHSLDDQLGCFLTVCEESALDDARQAERALANGEAVGPLHGVPYTLKDNIDTGGIRTTGAVVPWRDRVPERDATVYSRLRATGAILLGKVNLHELALGGSSDNRKFGATTHNPWNLDRIPGGSSGGSAASVAAQFCAFSIGTDTGGSIRTPSAFCGVVGVKPTYSRVSRHGVIVNCWSLDNVGPIGRTVADTAEVLGAIAGFDRADRSSSRKAVPSYREGIDGGVAGLRIGVLPDELLGAARPVIRERYRAGAARLESLGARVVAIPLKLLSYGRQAQRLIAAPEIAQAHADLLRDYPDQLSDEVRTILEFGTILPAVDYVRAQRLRAVAQQEMRNVFKEVDAFLTPNLGRHRAADREPDHAVGSGEREEGFFYAFAHFTQPFSVAGVPTISVPCGFDEEGLPIGLQVIGRPYDETTMFRVAHAYEQSTAWHRQVPPLAAATP